MANEFTNIDGLDSEMSLMAQRQVLKASVQRKIFCDICEKVADVRTSVLIFREPTATNSGVNVLCHGVEYDANRDQLEELFTAEVEIYDGRILNP